MRLRDNGLNFGLVSVICHWVGMATMLMFLISAGLAAFDDVGTGRWKLALVAGLFTAPVAAFRIYWRVTNYHPAPLGGANPAQVLVGRGIAFGMLVAGFVLPIMYWAKEIFWTSNSWWLTPLFWTGVLFFMLGFLLHLYGAFTHIFTLKDDSLKRLLGKEVEL